MDAPFLAAIQRRVIAVRVGEIEGPVGQQMCHMMIHLEQRSRVSHNQDMKQWFRVAMP